MSKYILTGHQGLIGRELKRKLIREGHTIPYQIDARNGFNILNLKTLQLNPKTERIDAIIHTAAFCKIAECIDNPELPFENNVRGTHEVLEFCRKNRIPKVIYFSSSRVLNKEKNTYTASKVFGEELCRGYHDSYGLDYVIIRPSTVYGGGFHDRTSRLITEWICLALKNKTLPIFGNRDKTLDFTYVTDFCNGVILTLNQKNEVYNISGENEQKLTDLADIIIKECKGGCVKFFPQEIAQPQQVKVDINKIKALGYKPKVSLEEGVKRTVNWYKKNRSIWDGQ
jgi:nucleoside-diphosphate-sugar epimerase